MKFIAMIALSLSFVDSLLAQSGYQPQQATQSGYPNITTQGAPAVVIPKSQILLDTEVEMKKLILALIMEQQEGNKIHQENGKKLDQIILLLKAQHGTTTSATPLKAKAGPVKEMNDLEAFEAARTQILGKHCFSCHGTKELANEKGGGLLMFEKVEEGYILNSKLKKEEQNLINQRTANNTMPPPKQQDKLPADQKMTADERKLIGSK